MGKIVDITSKLGFKENPKIRIRNTEVSVNTDAQSVLQIMGIYGDGSVSVEKMLDIRDILFAKEDRDRLDEMKLSFDDYMTVIETAVNLATGGEDEEPEKLETPDMTS